MTASEATQKTPSARRDSAAFDLRSAIVYQIEPNTSVGVIGAATVRILSGAAWLVRERAPNDSSALGIF
jgi:hypothetical protein